MPYEDWLDSAYDAWVSRPGVPQTPFYSGRTRTAEATGGALATAAGPDLRRLSYHVLNTGNDGRLSTTGKFVSNPAQVERVVGHMEAWHDFFLRRDRATRRHIVLWAHGGGVTEQSGLAIAQRQLNWWLNTGVFPISCVWETGPLETMGSAVGDLVRDALPFGGLGFDLIEQFDRLVEGQSRRMLRWAWREMKENARRASDPLPQGTKIPWRASSAELDQMSDMPGASLLVKHLEAYVRKHGRANVAIHMAAHSAGSIYQASLAQRFAAARIPIETMTWLGPAITVEEFRTRVVPLLGPGKAIKRFTCFDLSNTLELNDTVGPVYHKSAVYLVARGFEDALDGNVTEVPVVGLAKHWDTPLAGSAGEDAAPGRHRRRRATGRGPFRGPGGRQVGRHDACLARQRPTDIDVRRNAGPRHNGQAGRGSRTRQTQRCSTPAMPRGGRPDRAPLRPGGRRWCCPAAEAGPPRMGVAPADQPLGAPAEVAAARRGAGPRPG